MAQTKDEIETRNKAVVQASFEAWGAGTGSPYDLLADDASWTIVGHSVASKTYPSKEAFMSEVIRPFNARMSVGLKPTIRNIYADGDAVIIFLRCQRHGARRQALRQHVCLVPRHARRQGGQSVRLLRQRRVQRILAARPPCSLEVSCALTPRNESV